MARWDYIQEGTMDEGNNVTLTDRITAGQRRTDLIGASYTEIYYPYEG